MSTAITYPCPKCSTAMRTIERNGIVIELCTDCRGVFLDRGELDRLIDLEAGVQTPSGPAVGAGPWTDRWADQGGERRRWTDRDRFDDRDRWDDDDDDDWGGRGRRRGGLLGQLFDGFGD